MAYAKCQSAAAPKRWACADRRRRRRRARAAELVSRRPQSQSRHFARRFTIGSASPARSPPISPCSSSASPARCCSARPPSGAGACSPAAARPLASASQPRARRARHRRRRRFAGARARAAGRCRPDSAASSATSLLWAPRKLAGGSKLELMIFGAALAATAILTHVRGGRPPPRRARATAKMQTPRPSRRGARDRRSRRGRQRRRARLRPGFARRAHSYGLAAARAPSSELFSRKPSGAESPAPPQRAPWLDRESPSFAAPIDDFEPQSRSASRALAAQTRPRPAPDGAPRGASRVTPAAGALKAGKRAAKEAQPNLVQARSLRVPAAGHARRAEKAAGLQNLRGRAGAERATARRRARRFRRQGRDRQRAPRPGGHAL